MKPKKEDQDELLKDWYKPTARGRRARQLLEDDHKPYFG